MDVFQEQHSEKLDKQDRNSAGGESEALIKRDYVMRELIDTERLYVRDLSYIVNGYMAIMRDPASEIPMPEDLCGGKDKIVFGNIEAIYEWHRECVFVYLFKSISY